jgi:hypothetical protein
MRIRGGGGLTLAVNYIIYNLNDILLYLPIVVEVFECKIWCLEGTI